MIEETYEDVIKKATIAMNRVKETLSDFLNKVKNILVQFKPFFDKYGYDIKYLNKVAYMAKHAKKKRVRNKYRNMIKRTLGEEKLHRILED